MRKVDISEYGKRTGFLRSFTAGEGQTTQLHFPTNPSIQHAFIKMLLIINANNLKTRQEILDNYENNEELSWDKTIKLWDAMDGREIRRFKGHNDGVISAAFSSDGQYIASVSWDNTMKLWDVNEEKEIFTFSEYTGGAHSVMFSSNDRIITISENYIMNWDVKNRKLISSQWLSSPISSNVSFSRDKKFLLELDEKGTGIVLRDVNSGDEILKLKGHEEWLSEVSFSNDGNYIISIYRNGIINVWPYKPLQELIDETYERFINRPLVQEERQKYYLD